MYRGYVSGERGRSWGDARSRLRCNSRPRVFDRHEDQVELVLEGRHTFLKELQRRAAGRDVRGRFTSSRGGTAWSKRAFSSRRSTTTGSPGLSKWSVDGSLPRLIWSMSAVKHSGFP